MRFIKLGQIKGFSSIKADTFPCANSNKQREVVAFIQRGSTTPLEVRQVRVID